MKTPMKELIEQLKQEIEKQVQFRDEFEDGVVQGLEGALDLAESMLKKEKEVMCGIYDDALARVDRNYLGGEGEDYYNETFNTKERQPQ